MKFSTCLMKRNHKVIILINVKTKLVRENIVSLITNKIICQEVLQYPSLYQAAQSYFNKIDKFEHLGYEVPLTHGTGKVIALDKNRHSGIL